MPLVLNADTGVSMVQDNTITSAKIVDGSIQQGDMSLAASGLGVGQTWQNVIGSRVSGTTYTNSTGKPIQVSVTFVSNGSFQLDASTSVNGVVTGVIYAVTGAQQTTARIPSTFIVPNGGSYVVTATVGTIQYWSELR